MYKQAPIRSHRSKGIKVKHVLQICLLVAVCFWLIYQVKHSHEKRREFDAKDEKIVNKVQSDGDVLRFGRKDLPKSAELTTGSEKQGEEEEEKEAEEEENRSEEEGIKHEEDEPERDDGRMAEREEEKGGGDDETVENETEKYESDHVNGEELVDEDKEKEENEDDAQENHVEIEEKEDPREEEHSEGEGNDVAAKDDHSETEDNEDVDKEDQNERDASSDEQDHVGDATDTHEAQEELYKADDASSEVAHNVQTIIPETENVTTGTANDMFGKASSGLDNGTEISSNPDTLIKTAVQLTEKIGGGISNVTVTEKKKYDADLSKLEDGSPNNTSSFPNHQLAISSNSTSLDVNLSDNSSLQGTAGHTDQSMVGNMLESTNKSKLATGGNEEFESSADLNETENVYKDTAESLSSNNTTVASIQKANGTDVMEVVKDSSVGNGSQVEKSENSEAAGSDVTSTSHSYDENSFAIQHDPIDASDTRITEEEKESRTDLDTLPEIRTEAQNSEEAMAE